MLSLSNLTSYVPPVPIVPHFPDFALCHSAYGAGLKKEDGLHTGGILPYGTNPITYTVNQNKKGRASQYDLPVQVSYSGVKIAVQVAGPVNIESMALIPNDVRGMAAYLATFCAGRVGTGGFVTKSIQGLVDFVTDPTSDLGASTYPNSTAFVTVTMSSPDIHTSAGNYDPAVALVLQRAEEEASRRLPLSLHFENLEIADRIINYRLQAGRMRRLGALAWWDEPLLQGNPTEVSNGSIEEHSSNVAASKVGTSRRKKSEDPQAAWMLIALTTAEAFADKFAARKPSPDDECCQCPMQVNVAKGDSERGFGPQKVQPWFRLLQKAAPP